MNTVALRTRNLSVGYHGVPVVRDVDLEVHRGEMVALLGANGAGKTTMLLGVVGALGVLGGEVELLGASARGPLEHRARRGLGFVPEQRAVITRLTVAENLRLGLGPPARALEWAPELRPLLGRRAGLLSGGEQQILALARALAAEPRLLVIDELSLGLSPQLSERAMTTVRCAADTGTAVLVVEQRSALVLAAADRGYVMSRGRIVATGDAGTLARDTEGLAASYLS